jgi:phenylalanyl-tRNA synthetase alpha chain
MDLNQIEKEVKDALKKCQDLTALDDISRRYLGKKGGLNLFFQEIKKESGDRKKKLGQELNQMKVVLERLIEEKRMELSEEILSNKISVGKIDVSRPGKKFKIGHLHPLTKVIYEIEDIFQSMGFSIVEGPELETDYYNFDALNIPADHPARDVWDTFWLKDAKKNGKNLLRTHTSPNQARYMEKNNPPLRIIVPGVCYRHEATDRSHGFQFLQIEGLMVDREISLANFKSIIEKFCESFFGKDVALRIVPDYFPFTEPSLEVSILDKRGHWLEIMGAGLVHPNVFKAVGYQPHEWRGFAFGAGIDRLAMLKYGIDDIRMLYQGDLRLIEQF